MIGFNEEQPDYKEKSYTAAAVEGNDIELGLMKSYDRIITFNDNDPDLKPIVYTLPSPPPLETIDGYGLPASEQIFRKPKTPQKLIALNKEPLTSNQKVMALEANPDYYADEIAFIEKEWYIAENGYWFFNNGRPTYITNYHYLFLVRWYMQSETGLPFFTMYDREAFLFAEMCFKDPFCFGFNWPKHRRAGASSIATCIRYFRAIMHKLHHAALQSMDEQSAKKIHANHMVYGWDKMSFWFKPVDNNNTKNTSEILFFAPRFKNNPDYSVDAIESRITYGTSTETFYDGDKLHTLHNDEVGKTLESNVYKRWRIQKPTLSLGSKIIGKAMNTSTVEEMLKGGGDRFKLLCDESDYHKRNPTTKQTLSGLYNMFIPAYEKMEGDNPQTGKPWIDKYGFCSPDAEGYIHAQAKQYEESGNTQGRNDHYRLFPCVYRDCWRPAATDSPFNLTKINNRLDKLDSYQTPLSKRGDFEWYPGKIGEAAYFRLDEEGPFNLSWDFDTPDKANQRGFDIASGLYCPVNTHLFTSGGDIFGYRQTSGTRKSKAGFAIKYKLDPGVDNVHSTDPALWKSDRFICTYLGRPEKPELAIEKWAMACVYFSMQIYPENNINTVNDWFIDNGLAKYLYFDIKDNGKFEVNAGDKTDATVKDLIFSRYQNYVSSCVVRDCHPEILTEIRDISGPEEMTKFDLFTGGGYALLAEYRQVGASVYGFSNPSKNNINADNSLDDVLFDYDDD